MKKIAIIGALILAVGCKPQKSTHREGESQQEHDNQKGQGEEHPEDEKHEGHDAAEHGGDADESNVRVPVSVIKNGGVRIGKSKNGVLKDALEVPAEVQLPPDHVAHVSPLVDGQLLNVQVGIGDQIKKGQPLAVLRSVTLGRARAEYARTTALLKVAKQTLERQKNLREEGISSERSYLDAKAAYDQANAERGAALSGLSVFGTSGGSGPDMTLVSPIDGMLVERHATQGENVSPGDTLFVVANTSRVWVIGQAYERQLSRVVPSMKATLTLTAFPSKSWEGKVSYIGSTLNETARTLPIRVEIDNQDGLLRAGLFGSLRLYPEQGETSGVLVPITAVQQFNGNSVVFVPEEEEGVFAPQPVTLGRENKVEVEVLQGLTADSAIVVDGGFILKSELMREQLGHGHEH